MRTVRVLLILAGAGLTAYGGWLVWPSLPTAAVWLLAGPVVNDALVSPVIGLCGLLLGRARARWLLGTGLALTAVLLLIAVPLMWRPHAAPPNPGLQDRDYVTGLAVWLGLLWGGILLGGLVRSGDEGDRPGWIRRLAHRYPRLQRLSRRA